MTNRSSSRSVNTCRGGRSSATCPLTPTGRVTSSRQRHRSSESGRHSGGGGHLLGGDSDRALRDSVRNGAQLLAVPTNNATSGSGDERTATGVRELRAVEHGRYLMARPAPPASAPRSPRTAGRSPARTSSRRPTWTFRCGQVDPDDRHPVDRCAAMAAGHGGGGGCWWRYCRMGLSPGVTKESNEHPGKGPAQEGPGDGAGAGSRSAEPADPGDHPDLQRAGGESAADRRAGSGRHARTCTSWWSTTAARTAPAGWPTSSRPRTPSTSTSCTAPPRTGSAPRTWPRSGGAWSVATGPGGDGRRRLTRP